jgi:hypothetical protein
MNLDLTTEQRSEVVYALLGAGVPPTAIARALSLDVEYVKGAQSLMHTERYGTDEIAEAMAWLQWEAYEEALNQIHTGTPANKARFIQLVLARSIGLAGKSTPETGEKIRAALAEMTADLTPNVQLEPSIYDPTE